MRQRGPRWISSLLVCASVAASCAASGPVRAADECMAKPGGLAPRGEHWYYRIDRGTKRQCWYLAPQAARAQRNATETLKQPASDSPATPAEPRRLPHAPATDLAAAATGSEGFSPAAPPPWPQTAGFPDAQPSFELVAPLPLASAARTPDAIEPARAPAVDRAEVQEAAANARPSNAADAPIVAEGDHAFALTMLTAALLAIVGSVFHATRGQHRRKLGRGREPRPGPSTLPASGAAAATARDVDAQAAMAPPEPLARRDDVVHTLQMLLAEARARQYAREATGRARSLA